MYLFGCLVYAKSLSNFIGFNSHSSFKKSACLYSLMFLFIFIYLAHFSYLCKLYKFEVFANDHNLRNPDAELQQRAVEYLKLAKIASPDVLATVFIFRHFK